MPPSDLFYLRSKLTTQILMGLWPIIPAGTADIVPVLDMAKMLSAREARLKS